MCYLLGAALQCYSGDAVLYGGCRYSAGVTGHPFGIPYCVDDNGNPVFCPDEDPAKIVGYSCGADTPGLVEANVVCCGSGSGGGKAGRRRQPRVPRKKIHTPLTTPKEAPKNANTPQPTPKVDETPQPTHKTVDNPPTTPKIADNPQPTPQEAFKVSDTPQPNPQEAPKTPQGMIPRVSYPDWASPTLRQLPRLESPKLLPDDVCRGILASPGSRSECFRALTGYHFRGAHHVHAVMLSQSR